MRGKVKSQLCDKGRLCQCSVCTAINKDVSPNLRVFGGQSLGISDVKYALNVLSKKSARYRSILFVALSSLSNKSANSLLKLIEEPPLNTQIFIGVLTQWVLTTTILSRCSLKQLECVGSGGSLQAIISQDLEVRLKIIKKWSFEKQLPMRICDLIQSLWKQERFNDAYVIGKIAVDFDGSGCCRAELIGAIEKLR